MGVGSVASVLEVDRKFAEAWRPNPGKRVNRNLAPTSVLTALIWPKVGGAHARILSRKPTLRVPSQPSALEAGFFNKYRVCRSHFCPNRASSAQSGRSSRGLLPQVLLPATRAADRAVRKAVVGAACRAVRDRWPAARSRRPSVGGQHEAGGRMRATRRRPVAGGR